VQQAFDVPGVSVAIVKDGQTVLAKGFGVRRLGALQKVDGQTLFGIASNTKVFTGMALGMLVDAGKLEWDAPVVRYLPWFQFRRSLPAGAKNRLAGGLPGSASTESRERCQRGTGCRANTRCVIAAVVATPTLQWALVGDLEHFQDDTFIVRWRDRELRADAYITSALNPDGTIDQAKMRAVSPATDFSFDFQDLVLKPVK
jgi:Beta-lactamase/Domain of unknown function (DUF3471)